MDAAEIARLRALADAWGVSRAGECATEELLLAAAVLPLLDALEQAQAKLAEVRQIAFNLDTISAIERGAIGSPPHVEGVSIEGALGYGRDALRDIRNVLAGVSAATPNTNN